MPSEPAPAEASLFDVSDADVDAAIEACHGDVRGAIRALLIAYAMLEREMSLQVSRGYGRRRQPSASRDAKE